MSDDAKLDDFVESQPDEESGVKHKKKMEVEIPPKTVELPSRWELMELQEVGDLNPSNVDKRAESLKRLLSSVTIWMFMIMNT